MATSLTEEDLYNIINEVKEIFRESDAPNEYKDVLDSIHPFIIFDDIGNGIYGRAYLGHSKMFEVVEYGISNIIPSIQYEGRKCWHIIELSSIFLNKRNRVNLYDTVSHELAHLLEFRINGYNKRKHYRYHNKVWKQIHRWMGGSALAVMKNKY